MAYFDLGKYNSSISKEFTGGATSFLAAFYIIIVNPAILSQAGLSLPAVTTATILIASFSCILMGLYANIPIVLAPGMGLNAYFTYSVIIGEKISPEVALGIVFWSGIIFILLSVFKIREYIVNLIPVEIRYATSCGIGVFIAFIGFKNAGLISSHPVTLVSLSKVSLAHLNFSLGLIFTAFLYIKKIKASLILGILFTTFLCLPMGRIYGEETLIVWKGLFAAPDFSLFGILDLKNSLKPSLIPIMFSFIFTDLFDTLSTLIGVSEAGGIKDEKGEPRNLKKSLIVDAVATTASAIVGSSPTTSYIESATGVSAGARTGLSSIFAGLLFLPFLFMSPLLSLFPTFVTSPVLVLVGVFMFSPIVKIDWNKIEVALPAFLGIIMIPLTFSISHGIVAALVSYYLLKGISTIYK